MRAGHDPLKLPHYTERQLELYYRSDVELTKAARAALVIDVNAGTVGGKTAQAVLKALGQ